MDRPIDIVPPFVSLAKATTASQALWRISHIQLVVANCDSSVVEVHNMNERKGNPSRRDASLSEHSNTRCPGLASEQFTELKYDRFGWNEAGCIEMLQSPLKRDDGEIK